MSIAPLGRQEVTFDVIGLPRPQGSKKAFMAGGKARMKEASDGHATWRNQVAEAARSIAAAVRVPAPLDGPLTLGIEFRFPMPASRSKRVRDYGWAAKTTAPDLSKLVRCVEDGLQAGGLIVDDARITEYVAVHKIETTGWTGAVITIGYTP